MRHDAGKRSRRGAALACPPSCRAWPRAAPTPPCEPPPCVVAQDIQTLALTDTEWLWRHGFRRVVPGGEAVYMRMHMHTEVRGGDDNGPSLSIPPSREIKACGASFSWPHPASPFHESAVVHVHVHVPSLTLP